MFTGLVSAIGKIAEQQGSQYTISCPEGWLGQTVCGDSIAVNGACLTVAVAGLSQNHFTVHVSPETKSRCVPLAVGATVNLEKSLCVGDSLGGHFVTGHVDGLAMIKKIQCSADGGKNLFLATDPLILRLIAVKGSVALAGVSLTVNEVTDEGFSVYLIPQTVAKTTLQFYQQGESLNIEIDLIARYLSRLLPAMPA